MQVEKGLKRLAWVTLGPYFAFWVFQTFYRQRILTANSEKLYYAMEANDVSAQNDALARISESEMWLNAALTFGLIIPAIVLGIVTVILWVYRGFNPKPVTDEPKDRIKTDPIEVDQQR